MQSLDILIFGQRALEQFQQVLFAERLQHIHLASTQQRRYHLEGGVLCRRTNQGNGAFFYCA